jgi:hypothetical protein
MLEHNEHEEEEDCGKKCNLQKHEYQVKADQSIIQRTEGQG